MKNAAQWQLRAGARLAPSATVEGLLERVRSGRAGAIVVHGEAGIGKTTVVERALADAAHGCRIERVPCVESETGLEYAALHQVCAPLLEHLAALPIPQREALAAAFGLSAGGVPDRFFVGLAVLGLFAEASAERPLAVVIDAAQWLDRCSARALAFVARRLSCEQVALVFVTRALEPEFAGLPALHVDGLCDRDACALLATVVRGPLDPQVRDRIVAETRGNPRALQQLPGGASAVRLAGGFGLPPLTEPEAPLLRDLEALGCATRLLLLVAAAEPCGDPQLLWRAAHRLGLARPDVVAAEQAQVLEVGSIVTFRDARLRPAVYHAATPEARRRVHATLAGVTDAGADPDRRAWHRAHAVEGADEEIAGELERTIRRARGRGGRAAVAAFRARAAALTAEPERRAARMLTAAKAARGAGGTSTALELLNVAERGPLEGVQHVDALKLRARITLTLGRSGEAIALLLDAAAEQEQLGDDRARATYLEAFEAATQSRRGWASPDVPDVAAAARHAAAAPRARGTDLLLAGLIVQQTEDYAAGAAILRPALDAVRAQAGRGALGPAMRVAGELFEYELADELGSRLVHTARTSGRLSALPTALGRLAFALLPQGRFTEAAQLLEEARELCGGIGTQHLGSVEALLAAWRGRPFATATQAPWFDYAAALRDNGLGHSGDALAAARRSDAAADPAFGVWILPELIVAAVGCRRPALAADALWRLREYTQAAGTATALGIESWLTALVSPSSRAEGHFREAIDLLDDRWAAAPLARARLAYGEWLRRERRRVDARTELRAAEALFSAMGASVFAARAERELEETGEPVRSRALGPLGLLTPQEERIARLARDGLSNVDIGTRLFISPRTVEYHLHKVFGKLNIAARTQLPSVLPDDAEQGLSLAR